MSGKYEKWIEKEKEEAKERERKHKRKSFNLCVLITLGIVLAIIALGFGIDRVEGAIRNAKFGVIYGGVQLIFLLLIVLPINSSKRYMKYLKREVEKQLPDEVQRENFAAQILGLSSDSAPARKFSVNSRNKKEQRVYVTRDYVLYEAGGIFFTLVRLKDVEHAELDVEEHMNHVDAGDLNIRINYNSYPIYFFYKNYEDNKKKKCFDKMISFEKEEERAEVLSAIQELSA